MPYYIDFVLLGLIYLFPFVVPKRIIDAGEVVGDFQIQERIDYLGYQKVYAIDDNTYNLWAHGMRVMPSVEDASLTVLKDIKIDVNSRCIFIVALF